MAYVAVAAVLLALPFIIGAFGLWLWLRGVQRRRVADFQRDLISAEAMAKASLSYFLGRLAVPQPGDEGFVVRVRLTGGDTEELVWVEHPNLGNGCILGHLTTVPNTPGYFAGQQLEIRTREIVDWGFRSRDAMHGYYTTRVLFGRMPKSEVECISRDFGWNAPVSSR